MKKLLLAWLLSASAHAAMTVTAFSQSPTQAILSYTAPTSSACTVEVSESGSYAPLSFDVDASLFAGANLDSRTGALSNSTARLFLVGTRRVMAADVAGANFGLKYSRALQNSTLHHYRVTCDGPTVVTGTFTTMTPGFGATYQDTIPANADGSYNQPDIPETRNFEVIDSQLGTLHKRASLLADAPAGEPWELRPPWTPSSGFGSFCADDLSAQGNNHCVFPGQAGNGDYFYAINPTTGNVTFLGIPQGQMSDIDALASGTFGVSSDFFEITSWGYGSAVDIYTAVNPRGRDTIARWTYTGTDTAPLGSPPNFLAGTTTDMLGGANINTLARTFNSHFADYDITGTVTTTGPSGTCSSGGGLLPQYTVTWVSGGLFVDGNSMFGKAITINGIPYTICSVPSHTTMIVNDRYGLTPAANPTAVAWRWQLFNCSFKTTQHNYAFVQCPSGDQDSPMWNVVYDFGNGIPLGGGGSTAGVIAMVDTFSNTGSRWSSSHSLEFLGQREPIMAWATGGIKGYKLGWGPYKVVLGTNLPARTIGAAGGSPVVETNVVITTASLVGVNETGFSAPCDDTWTAPAGWVDGNPLSGCFPHFLQSLQVGDVFWTDNGTPSATLEFMQITVKHDETHYDIQRGTQNSFITTPSHTAGEVFLMYPNGEGAAYNAAQAFGWGYMFWDFLSSPNGFDHVGDFVLNWGNHPITRGTHRSEYLFDPDAAPTNKSRWGVPGPNTVAIDSVFSGVTGTSSSFQKHPSMASGNDYSMFDVWYFVGGGNSTLALVGANTHVWKSNAVGPPIGPKFAPIFGKTQGRSLVDLSSHTKILSDADDYAFCYAHAAGECETTSAIGDLYFSLSTLDLTFGSGCTGGENPSGLKDICIQNMVAGGVGITQFKYITPDEHQGRGVRALSRLFSDWEMQLTMSGDMRLTYAGDWGIIWRMPVAGCCASGSQVWTVKIPPDPGSDGIDRTTFIPAILNLTPPAGLGITKARAKFGYLEYGGTPTDPHCASRNEPCVAVNSTANQTATASCASLSNTCQVAVTALGMLGATVIQSENPFQCTDANGIDVGATVYQTTGTTPITSVGLTYPANTNITCKVWGAPFYYLSDTYTAAACSTSCTIALPIAPLHTAVYSVEYLNSGNSLVTTQQGFAMENNVFSLQLGGQSLRLGNTFKGGLMQ